MQATSACGGNMWERQYGSCVPLTEGASHPACNLTVVFLVKFKTPKFAAVLGFFSSRYNTAVIQCHQEDLCKLEDLRTLSTGAPAHKWSFMNARTTAVF